MHRAVAVDFGASSGRIALGTFGNETISFEIVDQVAHEPSLVDSHLRWDFAKILGLCEDAVALAKAEGASSVAIDSWGVDVGYLDHRGELLELPICYRDLSHLDAFQSLAPFRRALYRSTGTQHQPFNTICQLVARKKEDPFFSERTSNWLILPDLLGYLLGGSLGCEFTQASTTQLLSVDGQWSAEAFEIAGWPIPKLPFLPSGTKLNSLGNGVDLVAVGSHDTASAVAGFGDLGSTEMFLNVGTWSLAGSVITSAFHSQEAEQAGFTNERTVDGRIRFLKNIPGFYFINRLHSELEIQSSVPDWLKTARASGETIDLLHPEFFNPDSMLEICRRHLAANEYSSAEWAGIALESLADAVKNTSLQIGNLTGQTFRSLRVGGGGSQSKEFCQILANKMRIQVLAGPAEATVLGNLAVQFLAQGIFSTWSETYEVVSKSARAVVYLPAY